MLVKEMSCPVAQACRLVGLPRSNYYYSAQKPKDEEVSQEIEAVLGEFSTYGTRRVSQQLRRTPHGLRVNRKRVQRIMRQEGWLQPVKHRTYRTTNSRHPYPRYPNRVAGLVIHMLDQVWVADITYIRLRHEFIFLAVVLDVFSRCVRGWCLSRQIDQELTLQALRMALQQHTPHIHHSDQGIQYAAQAYIALLQAHQVEISMAAVGKAEENGYAERFMRTLKEEEVDLSEYRDFQDAYTQIGYFIEAVYNHKRIHSALGYLTPVEFELAYRLALTQPGFKTPLSKT